MKRAAIVLAILVVIAASASAQTVVVNPTTIEFTVSSDHNTVNAIDGTPVVTRYDLRIYIEAGMTLVATVDIGKPTPLANQATITNPAWFAPLQSNTRMVARVVAIGPTGEAASNLSNPFGVVGPPAPPPGVPSVRK